MNESPTAARRAPGRGRRDRLVVIGLILTALMAVRCVSWQRSTGRFETDYMEQVEIDPFARCVAVTEFFAVRRELAAAIEKGDLRRTLRSAERLEVAWNDVVRYIRDFAGDGPLPVNEYIGALRSAPGAADRVALRRAFDRDYAEVLDELDGDSNSDCVRRR